MSKIDWNGFDGTEFQKLCNTILLFEVSKHAQVFSAPGKDKGRDQLFEGTYDGKSGKWRFQDKFHHSGDVKADINELKRDIKDDIRNNFAGEDHIVFFTNVNLGPGKYKELLEVAKQELAAIGAAGCTFHLWHEPNLEVLLVHLPLVFHWFWQKESLLLQPYNEYFNKELTPSTIDLRYQLRNMFFGRQNELNALDGFLKDSSENTLALIAGGGYGKTRLLIEFFKTLDNDPEWISLVLTPGVFHAGEFARLLKGTKRFLILIDDAHNDPQIVSDAKHLIDSYNGRHRLVLTTRPALLSELISRLPSHSRNLMQVPLPVLPYEERKKMLTHELPTIKEANIIHLADASKGVPNVMLEFVRLVKSGKQPSSISGEATFFEGVREILQQIVDDINRKTGIAQEASLDLVRMVSLTGPLSNGETDKTFLAEFIGIRVDKLERIIIEFVNLGLLNNRYNLSVKPDPYKDAILADIIRNNQALVQAVLKTPGTENYQVNILKNLAEVGAENVEGKQYIDSLLLSYISTLARPEDAKKYKSIFEFIEKITYRNPWAAVYAIEQYIQMQGDQNHPVHTASTGGWMFEPFIVSIKAIIDRIFAKLCTYTSYARSNKHKILQLVEGYIHVTGDFSILRTCYRFKEWDFSCSNRTGSSCCETQLLLKSVACTYLVSRDNPQKVQIALVAASLLLQFEYNLEEYFEPATGKFTYGHGLVLICEHVVEIRKDILQALIQFYDHAASQQEKEQVMELLLPFIRYTTEKHQKEYPQNISDEITLVIEFFIQLMDSHATANEKSQVLTTISRAEQATIKKEFLQLVTDLKAKAAGTASLREALELILMNGDYHNARLTTKSRLDDLISKYPSFEDFSKELMSIRLQRDKPLPQFSAVIQVIGKNYSEEAKKLVAFYQAEHPELFDEARQLVAEHYKDEAYFTSILDWLWQRKEAMIRTLLWLITYGRERNRHYYKDAELGYFEYALTINDGYVNNAVCYQLPDYAYINKESSFKLLDYYLKYTDKEGAADLVMSMFDNSDQFQSDFKEELKQLFWNNLKSLDIHDLQCRPLLNFLDNIFGFDELLRFVDAKIEADLQSEEDRYWDRNNTILANPTLSEAQIVERYLKVVDIYVQNYQVHPEKYKLLLQLSKPGPAFNQILHDVLTPLIMKYATDKEKLKRISECVHIFPAITVQWIVTISEIAEKYLALDPCVNLNDLYGSELEYNYGLKSRNGKFVGYDQDIEKVRLLEETLGSRTLSAPVSAYLQECLEKVKEYMDQMIQHDRDVMDV